MSPSLFQVLTISSQDMNSRIEDLSNSSNSLSNVNTTGFKSSRMNFQELLNNANRSGSKCSSSQLMMTQGKLVNTNVPTDVAINGDGFFGVNLPNGETGYTRNGSFILDSSNQLLDSNGYKIKVEGTIPADASEIAIDQNGTITARVNDTWVEAGSIPMYRFTNPGGLTNIGNSILVESDNSGTAQAGTAGDTNFGILVPGSLENSNVNLADEMTHIIVIQRSFQMASSAFKTTSEMIDGAIHLRKV